MTQEQINDGNRLIAEFIGAKINHIGKGDLFIDPTTQLPCTEKELEYHQSWDWLIPVVEKIESLKVTESTGNTFTPYVKIGKNHMSISRSSIFCSGYAMLLNRCGDTKKEAVWLACVEFIKWYNEKGGKP